MYIYFEITQAFSAFCKVISVLVVLDFWGRKVNASDLVSCECPCPKRFVLLLPFPTKCVLCQRKRCRTNPTTLSHLVSNQREQNIHSIVSEKSLDYECGNSRLLFSSNGFSVCFYSPLVQDSDIKLFRTSTRKMVYSNFILSLGPIILHTVDVLYGITGIPPPISVQIERGICRLRRMVKDMQSIRSI